MNAYVVITEKAYGLLAFQYSTVAEFSVVQKEPYYFFRHVSGV